MKKKAQTKREYDPEKSHLSAELKAGFLETASPATAVEAIPGVGPATTKRLHEQGIRSVQDLTAKVVSFADLQGLLGPVNAHRVFEALEPFLKDRCEKDYKPKQEEELQSAMQAIALVDKEEDRALEAEIETARCILM